MLTLRGELDNRIGHSRGATVTKGDCEMGRGGDHFILQMRQGRSKLLHEGVRINRRLRRLQTCFGAQRLTSVEFNERVNRLANALHHLGIRKGDKVATILPNCLELLESYWAIVKLGAVIVPLSQLLRGKTAARRAKLSAGQYCEAR